MKRIQYAEREFGTDDRLADLVLEYAALLARSNSADTVTIPGRFGTGEVEEVSLLIGPASQITARSDREAFGGDASAATADLERRIRRLSSNIGDSSEGLGPGAIDDFDDLA